MDELIITASKAGTAGSKGARRGNLSGISQLHGEEPVYTVTRRSSTLCPNNLTIPRHTHRRAQAYPDKPPMGDFADHTDVKGFSSKHQPNGR